MLSFQARSYSGSDIRLVCKEAAMRPLRKIFDTLEDSLDDGATPEFVVDLRKCDSA